MENNIQKNEHIEPSEMLDALAAHIKSLMNDGTNATDLAALLDVYFRYSTKTSAEIEYIPGRNRKK